MLTKKITNNKISLSDISGKVWCEIVCNESYCVLTLFPQNIPEEFRGKKNTDTVKCAVSCASPAEAQRCQEALATLITNGYNDPFNWYIAMDIEDLMKIFSDEMNFCELTVDTDKLESYSETISKVNVNRKAFIYLRANEDTLNEYVLNAVLCPNAITEKDVEHWIQYSIDNEMPLGSVVIDVWYC